MGIIFDTGVWVGLASGQIADETVRKTAGNNSVFISAISLGELAFGVQSCSEASERARRMVTYRQIERVPVLEVSRENSIIIWPSSGRNQASGALTETQI